VGVAFAVALAGVLGQGSAIAQDASAAALEEIVITARKVEESLQDAPIAVSAFTDAGITERGIVDVNSLATFSPGLSFSQAFGRQNDRPVIRGQGNVLANVQFGVESGTAYFIDGVYYNGDIQAIDFDSLQRVEVIKGPQSALYGRNTYAGAINFITRDPRMDAWGGYANATAAESDEYKVAVSLDGPVWSDKLAMRIGGRFNTYDGEYVNQATGATVGDEEDWSVNATFLFTPTDDLSVRLFTNHRRQDDGPLALFLQGGEENNCAPGFRSIGYRGVSSVTGMATTTPVFGQFAPDGNPNQYYCGTIAAQPDGIWLNTDAIGPTSTFPNNGFADGTAFDGVEAHETFSSLGIDWDMGGSGWTLRALGGYRHNYDRFGTDSDHSEAFVLLGPPGVAEPLFANTNRNDRREWSSELKVLTPQERRVRGLLGAYYYYIDDQERDLTFASPEFGTLNGGNITGVKNEAVFGSVAFDVTEQFTVGAEVRYFEETKDRTEIGATGLVTVEQEATFRDTTPRVTLDYRLTDDLLIYGIYAQGVRPGGVNGSAGQATGRPSYEPETSENFELGLKSTWLDGRLRVNASAYFIDAEDVQVTQAIPGGGAGAVTSIAVNQAKAETIGGEIEVTAALTDYLTGTATFAYVDPEFQEGCDDFEFVLNSGGIAYNPATDFGSPLCDISGNRLPLTPETQGSLLLTYERPVADDMSFLVSGTYSYEGSKFVQVHNLAETGDTHLLGLRVGLSGDQWSFIAFGRNLTDEDTIPLATRWFDLRYGGCTTGGACRGLAGTAPANADRGSPRAFFGALRKGRTFGFEVRYKF
jgi:outer membrane receptor protein involved in Fe transport